VTTTGASVAQAGTRGKAQALPVTGPLRVGVYTRLSHDPDHEKAGIDLQERDCRERAAGIAASQDRPLAVSVFCDRDVSAFQRGVVRPEFQRMRAAVRAGELEVVVAYRLDRLIRRVREGAALAEECTGAGVRIVTCSDAIDTGAAFGSIVFHLFALLGEIESTSMSERQRRHSRARIESGRAHAGGARPFGLDATRQVEEPREAAAIREAARRVIEEGLSMRALAREWNGAEPPLLTTRGNLWQPNTLRAMLVNPRLSGVRMHQRERAGEPTGEIPAILEPELFARLVAVLEAPGRRTTRQTSRSYVLSGLVRCSGCGAGMVGRPTAKGMRRYICDKSPGRPGCGHRAIQADPLEDLVFAALERVMAGTVAEAAATRSEDPRAAELERRLAALARAKERLGEEYHSPENNEHLLVSRATWLERSLSFASEAEAIEAELSAVMARSLPRIDPGFSIRELWMGHDREWRRRVVDTLVGQITIGPGLRGRNRFDPERVRFSRWLA
jgi:site-specific DNA recombinase